MTTLPNNSVYQQINDLTQRVLNKESLNKNDGNWLIQLDTEYVMPLMAGADRIRKTFRGNKVEVCAISNVRSGNCSENCKFCAQSGFYETSAPKYGFISEQDLTDQAKRARSWGASDFGVVSKGWGVRSTKEKETLRGYFKSMDENSDIGRCASLGVLNKENAVLLKDMGMENYHHNLETAESFFDNICTTHTYQENIDTVKQAMDAGLRVCSGGILGMGESSEQRVELALSLRELGVTSVPLNFLNPQKGTPFENVTPLAPLDILKIISVFRFLLPESELRIAGGRQFLGDLQSMIFMAGASGIMIGDYLTTQGRSVDDDLKMLKDLNVSAREDTQTRRLSEKNKIAAA